MTTQGSGFLFDSLVATYSVPVRAVYTWQSLRVARMRLTNSYAVE
jgi:hypothetical protein